MKLQDLTINVRLALGFGAAFALLVGIALLAVSRMASLNDGTHAIVDDKYPKVVYAYEISGLVNLDARAMRNMVLWSDPREIDRERERLAAAEQEVDGNFAGLERLVRSPQGQAAFQAIKDARGKYSDGRAGFLKLVADGRKEEAVGLLHSRIERDQRAYLDAIRALIKHQSEGVAESGKRAETAYLSGRSAVLGLAALACVLGAGVAVWIGASIVRPIREAVRVARAVAGGDLTCRVEVASKDEAGQLLLALQEMNAALRGIVGDVRGGTETIAAASQQLVAGNVDLSSRTEEQASSLEETASSMEEMTSTVRHNADSAREANHLAAAASEVAAKGGAVACEMVGIMGEINESARKVVDIIGVIDGIAFQTNILALNAAVEAARAGEQGRGFAVVATEVRNLAQRSAAAAKEIKVLIDTSVEKVDAGAKLADQAGATMQAVVESNRRVSEMISEISAASQEQTAGIEQINQAITQMDQVTQQNAALVEEQAAASEAMQQQARKLAQAVSVFTVGPAPAAQAGASARTAAARAGKRAQPLKLAAAAAGTDSSWGGF